MDWLRAHKISKTATSYRKAESIYATEEYCSGRGDRYSRRSLANLVVVIQEALRSVKRQQLREATSISIAHDDRKDYKLVRFRCDRVVLHGPTVQRSHGPTTQSPASMPLRSPQASHSPRLVHTVPHGIDAMLLEAQPCSHEGVLGVMRVGGNVPENTIESHDQDKSVAMANSLLSCIKDFCTDWEGVLDKELFRHVLKNMKHTGSDQCRSVLKAGYMLTRGGEGINSPFPQGGPPCENLAWVSCDPAHQVRIAARDPLHAEEKFKEQWDKIFNNRHALVPDIQNSEVWKAQMIACQKRVVELAGNQGGEMTTILRHFSFAKQRFDSYAEPLMKFCLLLRAVCMLLAMKAADLRNNKEVRDRAATVLRSIDAADCVSFGISGDFAEETLRFVRELEPADLDVASIPRLTRDFLARMKLLFMDGHILAKVPDDAGQGARTLTQMVMDQVEQPVPIHFGNQVHHLHTKALPGQIRETMKSIGSVVDLMSQRVEVDLMGDPIGAALQAFDMELWSITYVARRAAANSDTQGEDGPSFDHLLRYVRVICRALRCEEKVGARDFGAAVKVLLPTYRRLRASHPDSRISSRAVWSWLLDQSIVQQVWPKYKLPSIVEELIRFYVSITAGTLEVERGLGKLVAALDAHSGPLSEDGRTVAAIVETRLDGPKGETGLFTRLEDGGWEFTDLGRHCQELFIHRFGRRFRSEYSKSSGVGSGSIGRKKTPRKQGAALGNHKSSDGLSDHCYYYFVDDMLSVCWACDRGTFAAIRRQRSMATDSFVLRHMNGDDEGVPTCEV